MITERGPHGTVAVMTIESGKDVVPHALDALRSHSCKHCLPVYLREIFGQKQICADCTSLVRVTDPAAASVYRTIEERRNAIADLLISVCDMLDLMMEPSGLSFCPEDIWLHPGSGDLYFLYLPLRTSGTQAGCNLSGVDATALESLLLNDFFAAAVSDDSRHRLIDCVIKGDESGFLDYSNGIRRNDGEDKTKQNRFFSLSTALSAILFMMLISLYIIFRLTVSPTGFFQIWEWGPVFSLVFLLLTITACSRFGLQEASSSDTLKDKEKSASIREIFFPDMNHTAISSDGLESPSFEPGFLIEQSDYGKRVQKKRRCVIWTDDFLIGSDQLLCDFSLDHPSVCARHARIVRRQGLFFLVDLGSRCGSYIGHRKLYTQEESPLSDGDTVRIGEIGFIFSFGSQISERKSLRPYSEVLSP